MVVQSISLPKVSGATRDPEIPIVPAVPQAVADPVGRFSFAPAVVPVLVATQAAWLTLLGYAVLRFVF